MTILIVDDEPIILEGEMETARACAPGAQVLGSADPARALELARTAPVDVAILDIEMPGMNGIELAQRLKRLRPACNIIFATAYSSYTGKAMDLHASGYILKPMNAEKLRRELEDLRTPVPLRDEGLYVRCFGDFEVFDRGYPLAFTYHKAKELLAYLVDRRGAVVSIEDCKALLWPEDPNHSSYFKQVRKDLIDTLTAVGRGDVLVRQRGGIGVLPERLHCDYYDWLAGRRDGVDVYRGEYMSQYSWAEITHAGLERSL